MNHRFTGSIPSSCFTYHAPTRTFSVEASCLNGYNFLQKAHENSSLRGFVMKSVRTGKELPFYFVTNLQELEEFDGELHGWLFTSDWRDLDSGEIFHVHILND